MAEDTRPVALLVGASSGLGRALAVALAKDYRLILLASSQARLEQTDDLVRQQSGKSATLVPFDLQNHDDIHAMVARIWQRFTRLDLFIGLAATIAEASPLAHLSPELHEKMHRVNYLGIARILSSCDPVLRHTENARVIMITGTMNNTDDTPNAYTAAFNASKAALDTLSSSYALELEQTSVRVATVHPRPFASRLRRKIFPGLAENALPSAREKAETLVKILRNDTFTNGMHLEI